MNRWGGDYDVQNAEAQCRSAEDYARELATQLAAATKRADDAEKQRDAAVKVLRDIDWKSGVCLSCGAMICTHAPDCALAACLNGGAE